MHKLKKKKCIKNVKNIFPQKEHKALMLHILPFQEKHIRKKKHQNILSRF